MKIKKLLRSSFTYIKNKPKYLRIDRKNSRINENIRKFIRNKSSKFIKRETNIHPEIIIPCYNHGRYLQDALSSINIKTIPITIVNDASTDNSLQFINDLSKKYKFKLINNNKNLRMHGSINKAIRQSSNNLFIILNADDCLTKYAIRTILNIFEIDKNIHMVGGSCLIFRDSKILKANDLFPEKLPYSPRYKTFGPKEALLFNNLNSINMTSSSSSFLKSAWESVGGFKPFEERICSYDDRDFEMRVCTLYNIAVLEEALAFWRLGSSVWDAFE